MFYRSQTLDISRGGTVKMGRGMLRLELARGHGFCWHERREWPGWMEAEDLLGWALMGTTNGEEMIPKCSNHPPSPFMQLLTAPSITLWHLAWKTVDVVAGALSHCLAQWGAVLCNLSSWNAPILQGLAMYTLWSRWEKILLSLHCNCNELLKKAVNHLPLWSQNKLSSFLFSCYSTFTKTWKIWYSSILIFLASTSTTRCCQSH